MNRRSRGSDPQGLNKRVAKERQAPESDLPDRSLSEIVALQLKLITFTASTEELLSIGRKEYFFGMLLVWLAGVGRAWDDPHAHWISKTGFSSVCYVYLMAFFLWALLGLVGARNWKLGRVLIFVCMTAPPAFLYAIPVEQFLPALQAEQANLLFLFLVSGSRVALLVWFTIKVGELTFFRTAVAVFLPLASVINFAVWSDQLVSKFSNIGGIRREFKKVSNSNGQQGSGQGQFMVAGVPPPLPAVPATSTVPVNPNDFSTPAQVTDPGAMAPMPAAPYRGRNHNGRHGGRRNNVTSSTTGWMTSRGVQIANQPDAPGLAGMKIATPPKYVETIATPEGPVEVYSDMAIGLPGASGQVPPGYEEITPDDPINTYRHPLTKLLTPLAWICSVGAVPAFITYTAMMFIRPKRAKDEPEELDEEDDTEED